MDCKKIVHAISIMQREAMREKERGAGRNTYQLFLKVLMYKYLKEHVMERHC